MEDEIRKLREALAEQGRQLEEVQRRREEEQRRREEEQRRREKAEGITKPLSLRGYLDAHHSLNLAIDVITDCRLTTKGNTTNPVGRVYPRRIVPWDDFPSQQEGIWAFLADESLDVARFPSQHQMDYIRSVLHPISSEQDLRHFERDTVENAVQKLVGVVHDSPVLRDRLRLSGVVTFESHTNLGPPNDSVSPTRANAGEAASTPARTRQVRRVQTGGTGTADQFCIHRRSNGADIPVLAIEYKAPHKLTPEEVSTGLQGEIQPARDIINQRGEGFVFAAKSLTAAVVTQLFSYMVGKDIRYGYVCTGQAFVFLHIPDDPTMVRYYVCMPNADVSDDDESRLHRTAVAQVFAFLLQSVRVSPPTLAWHDAAADLDTWSVEYDDVLRDIPESVRKEQKDHTPYKARSWKGPFRSPIRTRSSCKPTSTSHLQDSDDDDNDNDNDNDNDDNDDDDDNNDLSPPTPTRARSSRGDLAQQSGKGHSRGKEAQITIQERPYCTHACLGGLARGGPIDATCPNAAQHGDKHMDPAHFLRLLCDQLARDRGRDADAVPLYLAGSVGSLFKVRLSAFGYTVVAKGMITENLTFLQGEKGVYDALSAIQGQYIPVCLGLINPILPLYYNGGVYRHLLLLSWAGQPLSRCFDQVDQAVALPAITAAYTQLHRLRVLHGDAHPRNILFDASSGCFMVADFERSTINPRPALGLISPNSRRKRKRMPHLKQENDEFTKELESVIGHATALFM